MKLPVLSGKLVLRIATLVAVLLLGIHFMTLSRPVSAVATTPTTMNFQGRLTNSAGNIMADGLYNMKFRIYDASTAGTLKWSELRETTNRVQVTNGLFSVQLGQVTPLDPTIFASGSLYFEIELPTPGTATCSTAACGTYTEGPMSPRNKLSTSAYAYNAETLDGLDSSQFARDDTANTFLGAQTVQATAANAFQVQNTGATETLFTANTSSNQVKIGNSTASVAADVSLLVLDNAPSTITPTGVAGAMYYDSTNNKFKCYTTAWVDCDTAANGVTTVGAFTGASIANGASISANTITLGAADGTNPGLVTIGNQTLAGNKTLTGTTTTNDIEVSAGKFIHLSGGVTGTRPATPTEGMIYFDSTTKELLTYANGKWKADSSDSTKIVAASNSSQALKDGADYVTTGVGDQTIINNALTAAAGGKVYLTEGTYTISGTILIPNNTVMVGAGDGTVITIPNAQNGNYSFIRNSDVTTGTGVTIRDLKVDGNKANQTTGLGGEPILFQSMGGGTGATARRGGDINNVTVVNAYGLDAIRLLSSNNNQIYGNTLLGNKNDGLILSSSANNSITGNTVVGNGGNGIALSATSDHNVISNNVSQGNSSSGIYLNSSSYNTVSGNKSSANITTGIYLYSSALYNTVSGNNIYDNGGATVTNGVWISDANYNSITGNTFTDSSCTSSCEAIKIGDSLATGTYLSNNVLGGGVVADLGTGTIYANQLTTSSVLTSSVTQVKATSTTALQVQNASAAAFFTVDTSGNKVQIGSATTDAVAVQLILDSYNSTTEPAGTNGAMYYNTALAQYRCYRDGDWEPCATKPIDRSFILEEEFISGAFAAAGAGIGNLNWVSTALSAGGCGNFGYNGGTAGTAVSADRPGILKLTTAATINAGCRLALGISGANTMMLAPGQVIKASGGLGNSAANTATLRIGADGATTAPGQWSGAGTSGVWWEADPTVNANWRYCYINSAGTAVCAASGVAIATNVLARLEIKINAVGTNTSNMDFIINGTTSNVSGVTLSTTGTVRPDILCYAQVAVAQGCYADYYLIRGDATAAR